MTVTLKQIQPTALRHTTAHIPPVSIPALSSFRLEQIEDLYRTYAVQCDKFLECHWYSTDQALRCLFKNKPLVLSYSRLLQQASNETVLDNCSVLCDVEAQEAQVVWETFELCRIARNGQQKEQYDPTSVDDAGLHCALQRLAVLGALVTGGSLETNPLEIVQLPDGPSGKPGSGLSRQIKMRELEFWQAIGRYVTRNPLSAFAPTTSAEGTSMNVLSGHDCPMALPLVPETATTLPEGQGSLEALQTARDHLDMFENRDVIYSIAVARKTAQPSPVHIDRDTAISSFPDLDTIIRPRADWSTGPSSAPVTTTSFSAADIAQPGLACVADERDPKSRLRVATRFLEDESQGKGTNQVIKRICGMAIKQSNR